jgi:hypothetical protein
LAVQGQLSTLVCCCTHSLLLLLLLSSLNLILISRIFLGMFNSLLSKNNGYTQNFASTSTFQSSQPSSGFQPGGAEMNSGPMGVGIQPLFQSPPPQQAPLQQQLFAPAQASGAASL